MVLGLEGREKGIARIRSWVWRYGQWVTDLSGHAFGLAVASLDVAGGAVADGIWHGDGVAWNGLVGSIRCQAVMT